MNISILVDMNLSPEWVAVFASEGIPAIHWSSVGEASAPDRALMEWAASHQHSVLTNDLDFTTILALTHQHGPSVILLRGLDLLPGKLAAPLISLLRQYEEELSSGAVLVVEDGKYRVRILPIAR